MGAAANAGEDKFRLSGRRVLSAGAVDCNESGHRPAASMRSRQGAAAITIARRHLRQCDPTLSRTSPLRTATLHKRRSHTITIRDPPLSSACGDEPDGARNAMRRGCVREGRDPIAARLISPTRGSRGCCLRCAEWRLRLIIVYRRMATGNRAPWPSSVSPYCGPGLLAMLDQRSVAAKNAGGRYPRKSVPMVVNPTPG